MGIKLVSSSGGSVEIAAPTTASNFTLTAPAATGTILNDVSSLAAANLTGNVSFDRLASQFLSNASLATSGYQKLPSGLIIQWGKTSNIIAQGTVLITFPIAFLNSVASVTANIHAGGTNIGDSIRVNPISLTQCYISRATSISNDVAYPAYWLAIGY